MTARVGIAAAVLTVPALRQLRGRWHLLRAQRNVVLAYGLIAVAACQVCYFNAVDRLSVGVALLLEYLGIIVIVLWLWVRHGQRPRPLTIAGSASAIGGLFLVLDVVGGAHVDVVGVLWGLCAALGLALFFVLSSRSDDALPPLAMAWAGLAVGAVALASWAPAASPPCAPTTGDVSFAGHRTSWLVPVLGLSLVAAVVGLCRRDRGGPPPRGQARVLRRAYRGAVRDRLRLAAAGPAAQGRATARWDLRSRWRGAGAYGRIAPASPISRYAADVCGN